MHIQMERLYQAAKTLKGITGQSDLARALNVSPQTVNNWETRGVSKKALVAAQRVIGCSAVWVETGVGPMTIDSTATTAVPSGYTLAVAGETDEVSYEIKFWDARGSCGGGSMNWDEKPKGKLVKEARWFEKYKVKPDDALVIYADGDSMADFIVDGDMVIFNCAKTEPKSGRIFLIQHPDGLRIKQLRREIDGTWVLESRNPDKRRFPDERIPENSQDLLVIKGEFVYRQGG